MTSMLVTRSEAAELSGTAASSVRKAVAQRVIPVRKRGNQSLIEAADVPVLVMLGVLKPMRFSVADKKKVRAWMRAPSAPPELGLSSAVVVRKVEQVELALERAEQYARLRDTWIVRDPQVKGGEPVIRGSRVGVHTLAARIAAGDSEAELEEDFPHIPAEARRVAVQFARANPRRGRPRRPPAKR